MRDAAIAIVPDPIDKSKILWVKRRDIPIWVLPGGGIDDGEAPDAAAIREVREETGLTVSILRKGAKYLPVNRFTAPTHVYICQVKGGLAAPQEESVEVQYFPLSEPPEPHFPLHAEWAQETISSPETCIERPLHEFSWMRVALFFLRHPLILLQYLWSRE